MAKEESKEIQRSGAGKEGEVTRPARAVSPFEEMDRMFDRWFDYAFPRGLLRPFRSELTPLSPLEVRMPKVDVIDRDDEVLVRAEIPGVEKNDLDVSISDNSVTIKGETKHEEKEEKGEYYRCEISQGAFTRTVALPDYVDTEKSKAKFKDGVLELNLPKIEKAKRRSIKID
jgi:HSP20 family protein